MPSDKKFLEYIIEQLELAGNITTKSMMGEYLIYCDDVYVALLSDNKFFVKPTEAGRNYIGEVVEKPAYPGAKPSFYIESQVEDKKWMAKLIQITQAELSKPKAAKKTSKPKKK